MVKCKKIFNFFVYWINFQRFLRISSFSAAKIETNVERTNVIFGGMNPAVTNVFFTQGQLDPWRPMGLQEDLNAQSPTVVIPCKFSKHFCRWEDLINFLFYFNFSAFTLF